MITKNIWYMVIFLFPVAYTMDTTKKVIVWKGTKITNPIESLQKIDKAFRATFLNELQVENDGTEFQQLTNTSGNAYFHSVYVMRYLSGEAYQVHLDAEEKELYFGNMEKITIAHNNTQKWNELKSNLHKESMDIKTLMFLNAQLTLLAKTSDYTTTTDLIDDGSFEYTNEYNRDDRNDEHTESK